MREPDSIAARVVLLPRRFVESRSKSIKTLLAETGYPKAKESLSVGNIKEALVSDPDYVSDWLQYSEDKRVRSGWYFQRTNAGAFSVGYLAGTGHTQSVQAFESAVDACALFITHEIESING